MFNADGGNIIYKFLGDTSNLDKVMKLAQFNVGTVLKGIGSAVTTTITTTSKALYRLTKESVEAYAEFEQLQGGAQKIFDEIDYAKIEEDARKAYKTMNLSASQYLSLVNDVGATFASTMGDEKGYKTAKEGLQAISDYASGTGKSVDLLGQKFTMITRSTSSYQSIADQFSGILPATSQAFLEQAKACGYLSTEYQKLTDVPIAEYQEAVSQMLTKGVSDLGLANNTYKESTETLTGSIASARSAFQNFISGSGGIEEVVDSIITASGQILKAVKKLLPKIVDGLVDLLNGLIPEIPGIIKTLLPTFLNGVVELIRGIVNALPDLLRTIANMLPTIVQSLVDVFVDVCNMFAEEAPTIVPIIVDAIMEAIMVLSENADIIIEASLALIIGLQTGIFKALPKLVEKMPDIVIALASALIESVPLIVESGVDLIKGLIKGILSMNITLISKVVDLVKKLPENIKNIISKMVEVGKNLIKGLWEGITKFDIVGKVKDLAGGVINGAKKVLGIASPSKEFAYLGEMSAEGYINELDSMKGLLNDTIQSTFSLSPNVNGNMHYSPNVIVNNSLNVETDPLGQVVGNIKTFANGSKNDYNYGMGV